MSAVGLLLILSAARCRPHGKIREVEGGAAKGPKAATLEKLASPAEIERPSQLPKIPNQVPGDAEVTGSATTALSAR